jgi:hypothetical protein
VVHSGCLSDEDTHKSTKSNADLEGNQPAQADREIARRGEFFVFKNVVWKV